MKKPEPEFQLQVFDGREYRTVDTGPRRLISAAFTECTERVRRVVRTDKSRPARPAYRRPPTSRVGSLDRAGSVSAYLAWAEAKGLKQVTIYKGDRRAQIARARFAVVEVDPLEHLGPATEETDDE
jgi:hypothetical protein